MGLALGGAVLAWLILTHYQLIDRQAKHLAPTLMGRSLVAYLLALVFFTSIYQTRLRSLVTATSTTVIATLISLSLLVDEKQPLQQTALYAGLIGLLLGETTWALNYWRANVLTVGVLLMLLFYVLIGITREHMRDRLDRRVLIEFLGVAALGMWIVIQFGPQ
jgi:intracellular septation protein A